MANQLGKGLGRVQFPGKHRLVSWLGGVLAKACPKADCYPGPHSRLTVSLAGRSDLAALFQQQCSVGRPRPSAGLSLPSLLAIPEEKSDWRKSPGRR